MANAGIKGIDRLTQRLNNVADMNILGAVQKATQLVHGQAKMLAPEDNGLLRESIHMEVKSTSKGVEGRVYTNTEYAVYVEFGTGIKGNGTYPYKIKGLNLKYQTEPWFIPVEKIDLETATKYKFKKVYGKGGEEFYICYGQKAQPYMYPALKENEKTIKQILKSGVKTNLKGGQ